MTRPKGPLTAATHSDTDVSLATARCSIRRALPSDLFRFDRSHPSKRPTILTDAISRPPHLPCPKLFTWRPEFELNRLEVPRLPVAPAVFVGPRLEPAYVRVTWLSLAFAPAISPCRPGFKGPAATCHVARASPLPRGRWIGAPSASPELPPKCCRQHAPLQSTLHARSGAASVPPLRQ